MAEPKISEIAPDPVPASIDSRTLEAGDPEKGAEPGKEPTPQDGYLSGTKVNFMPCKSAYFPA